ncbi:glycoside hydrolase family 2 TIM barrel-domain containing protein [Parasphingorhabdus litoris]
MNMRPETNGFREAISLDGIWYCRADKDGLGHSNGWAKGWSVTDPDSHPIAVPGSWNEQLAEAGLMNFEGPMWYQRQVRIPERAAGADIMLHFGSADYRAEIFCNGQRVGKSGPLMLPFAVDIGAVARPGKIITLVVKVTARLPKHGPMQEVRSEDYVAEGRARDEYWPAVRFDFFPFGGLNRSVHLCLLPKLRIENVTIDTGWSGGKSSLGVSTETKGGSGKLRLLIDGERLDQPFEAGIQARFTPYVQPWSPDNPVLYDCSIELLGETGQVLDRIERRIGFRTLRVEGLQLLLNDQPIILKGFGKHEDTPVHGRGVNLPMLVKDFGLLDWIGANSVRTSHYPYDEAFLDMADERGILVISECFSVNLDFRKISDEDQNAHRSALEAQFARDRHHASVVAWSLSNEPGYLAEPEYGARSGPYWRDLFDYARQLDSSRPMTVANVQYAGNADPAFDYCDFLTINRYHGWYSEPGQLDRASSALTETLDDLAKAHEKPIFISEFGADAVAGMHATIDQMWTEEYQSDLIALYWQIIAEHQNCIGGHVWNFADFRTAQHGRRAVMNRKGVFTRERDPKRSAFTLKKLWGAGT